MPFSHPKIPALLDCFAWINATPRPSGGETAIMRKLADWAVERGFVNRSDGAGNLVIEIPASPGRENEPWVAIQGHSDMVCEKTPGSAHDFMRDPIRNIVENDWLHADETSLGADNGIALALGMEAAVDPEVSHGPLELVVTVEEETGLTGAAALSPEFVKSRILLNIDSEDEGVFTVGCAGGQDTIISREFDPAAAGAGALRAELSVAGCEGGHSGIDIDRERANAIAVLTRALLKVHDLGGLSLLAIRGGTARNAIPRDAKAVIAIAPELADGASRAVAAFNEAVRAEFAATDPSLTVTFAESGGAGEATGLSPADSALALDLLASAPHGVLAMDTRLKGVVETSTNLAGVALEGGEFTVVTSQRSSVATRLEAVSVRCEALGRLAGAATRRETFYPPWTPDWDLPLIGRCCEIQRELSGEEPVVETIHAGLECAVIGARIPEMAMISFGPTIQNPHSPSERMHIPSVGRVWDFLVKLLAAPLG